MYNGNMKTCGRCGEEKNIDQFPQRKYRDGRRVPAPYCRPCKREYDRNYWASNEQYRNSNVAHGEKRRERNIEYVQKVLEESGGCSDCPETNPIVLEFDHLRDKTHNISEMCRSTYSIEAIQQEIDKCEIVCANCHRIRTHNRRLAEKNRV